MYEFLPFRCGFFFYSVTCLLSVTQNAFSEMFGIPVDHSVDDTPRDLCPNLNDRCLEVSTVVQHHATDLLLHPRPNGLYRIQIGTVWWPAIENCDFLGLQPLLHYVARVWSGTVLLKYDLRQRYPRCILTERCKKNSSVSVCTSPRRRSRPICVSQTFHTC